MITSSSPSSNASSSSGLSWTSPSTHLAAQLLRPCSRDAARAMSRACGSVEVLWHYALQSRHERWVGHHALRTMCVHINAHAPCRRPTVAPLPALRGAGNEQSLRQRGTSPQTGVSPYNRAGSIAILWLCNAVQCLTSRMPYAILKAVISVPQYTLSIRLAGTPHTHEPPEMSP